MATVRPEANRTEDAAADETAIVATVLDYFQGWFQGDAGRMERALHPQLAKRSLKGAAKREGESAFEQLESDTAQEMIEATARGVGTTRLPPGGDPQIQVEVVDVYDTIAAVVVRSAVYREYLHLVRTSAGWKIANALWQRV